MRVNMWSKSDEATQARWFEKHFGCVLQPVTNQRCGNARDFKIVALSEHTLIPGCLNCYVECKYDYSAAVTGNLFLEYEQTSDNGCTFQPSGMTLAVKQSKFIMFSVKHADRIHHYVFTNTQMTCMLGRHKFHKLRRRRTPPGKNGNRPGAYTRGYLLPVKCIPAGIRRTEHTSAQIEP